MTVKTVEVGRGTTATATSVAFYFSNDEHVSSASPTFYLVLDEVT
jgi:hypothetical protein